MSLPIPHKTPCLCLRDLHLLKLAFTTFYVDVYLQLTFKYYTALKVKSQSYHHYQEHKEIEVWQG